MCSSLNILGRPKEGERSQEPFFSGQLSRTGQHDRTPVTTKHEKRLYANPCLQ